MEVTKDAATAALHQETQRIKAALRDAETALEAAQAAAAEPRPQAEVIDAGTLERARLTDLAGITAGEVKRLEALRVDQSQALAAWQKRTAAAGEDCKRHTAAVAFHRDALAECRRLELVAFSSAADKLTLGAERAYLAAAHAFRAALMDLVAARTVAASASLSRTIAGTPLEGLGVIDVSRQIDGVGGVSLPSLWVLDADLNPRKPGEYAPVAVQITPDNIRAEARALAEKLINTLKDRA